MKHHPTETSLREVFGDWTEALNAGRLDQFYEHFHDEADILDEDYPWRMTKAEFVDHIAFHATSRAALSSSLPASALPFNFGPKGTTAFGASASFLLMGSTPLTRKR